jgi:CBS domain-containing protein
MIIQDEEIGKAMNLMNKHGIGHIVVIDKAGKLVGIASLTDIITDMHVFPRAKTRLPMAASHQRGKHTGFGTGEKTSLLSLPVHNIITHVPNCSTLSPKDSVAKAIDTMTGQGISSIVLTEKDIPVGILTIKDILEDYSKR